MRPQCGNLVITDSEMTLSLRCMFLPLPKKVTFWEIRTCMFLQQIVGLRCHFVFSLRFWHLFDVFQNLLISFKVHASDMASSVGLEQGCSSYALSNSVLSSLPRIGQGTGFWWLSCSVLRLSCSKRRQPGQQWRIDHIESSELSWGETEVGSPNFGKSSIFSSLKPQVEVRSSKFYILDGQIICQIRENHHLPSFVTSSRLSGTGGSEGLQPSADEGLQRWAEVAAQRGWAPGGARTAEKTLEGAGGPSTVSTVGDSFWHVMSWKAINMAKRCKKM